MASSRFTLTLKGREVSAADPFSEILPSLMTFQYGSVTSTVVAPSPTQTPASSTRSTAPSIAANTSIPVRAVGLPEILALVEMIGCPSCSISPCATAVLIDGDRAALYSRLL